MASAGSSDNSYLRGDTVEVYSNSKKQWYVGQITEIAADGSLHARFGRCLEKWVRPTDAAKVLRRHVPREVKADSLAPPLCVVKALLDCYRQDPDGRAAKYTFGRSNQISMHDIGKIWRASMEWTLRRGLEPHEEKHATLCLDRFRHESNGLAADGWVCLDEFVHFALLLVHPAGASAREAIAAEVVKKGKAKTIAALLTRWDPLDNAGTGCMDLLALTSSLKAMGVSGQCEDKAKSMLRSVDGDGTGFGSYSDFVALGLKMDYHEVCLYWYDLSNNWAKYIAPVLLWTNEEGIWHTGVAVFGSEYYYGGRIYRGQPCGTPFGHPDKIQRLGITLRGKREFESHVLKKLDHLFTEDKYDVLEHNCNHFSDAAVKFLLGEHIPEEILLQPQRAMASPMARMFRPLLNRLLGNIEGDSAVSSGEARAPEKPVKSVMESFKEVVEKESYLIHYKPPDSATPVKANVICVHTDGTKDVIWVDRATGKSREAKRVKPEALRKINPADNRGGKSGRSSQSYEAQQPRPSGTESSECSCM